MQSGQGRPRSLSYRFWKEFLWASKGKVRSTPDLFILILKGTPEGFHMGIYLELSKQILYKSFNGFLRVTLPKLTSGAPDHFPIDFGRNSLRISNGQVKMSTPDQFHSLRGAPEGFQMEIDQKLSK